MDNLIVSSQIESLSYAGTFIVMVLSGHLVPVPEEILLLFIGYASGIGLSNVYIAFIAASVGVMVGDSALFFLSKKGNGYVEKLKKRLNQGKVKRYEKMMNSHAGKTIFLSRFIIGLRFFSPILAGSLNVKWKTFLFSDFPAVMIYVGGSIFLGYHFHNDIMAVVTEIKIARHVIFVLVITLAGLLISYHVGKKFLRKINGGD